MKQLLNYTQGQLGQRGQPLLIKFKIQLLNFINIKN